MSSGTLVFRSPDLKGHCFGEYVLGDLVLGAHSSSAVSNVIIYNMCGLDISQ